MIPQYTDKEFIRAMQLLDLIILDLGSLSYKYSVLAASVMYHCQDEQAALSASGNLDLELDSPIVWGTYIKNNLNSTDKKLRIFGDAFSSAFRIPLGRY